jgi:hypothetical protein
LGPVGDPQTSDLAGGVISGNDLIVRLPPAVGALPVLSGVAVQQSRPPAYRRYGQRIELDNVRGGGVSVGWYRKGHGRLAFGFVEREAGRIEMQGTQCVGRPARILRPPAQCAKHRVPLVEIQASSLLDECCASGRAEEIGDGDATPRAQVDDAALGRSPRMPVGDLNIDVVFV